LRRDLWGVLTPLLGITVWFLLFWLPLQIEWTAPDARPSVIVLYAAPLVALAFGAVTRWSSLLLLTFPLSLIPAFLLMPELDQRVYQSLEGWLSVALAMLAYIAVAALWTDTRPPARLPADLEPIDAPRPPPGRLAETLTDDLKLLRDGRHLTSTPRPVPTLHRNLWWPYRVHFLPRLVLLTLLLLVPLYNLNFAEATPAAWLGAFGEQAVEAQVMANLLHLFVWIVVAYLFFLSPGLNLELEQRQLDQILMQLDARLERRPPAWIFIAAAVAAVGLMAALVALRLA